MWQRPFGLLAAALCLVTSSYPTISSELKLAKFDLNTLSLQRQQRLTLLVRVFAYYEASLEICGTYPNMERRVIAAAQNCIMPHQLAAVAKYFRERKEEYSKIIVGLRTKTDETRFDCTSEKDKKWLRDVKKEIDDQVDDIARSCRACPPFIC